MDEELIEKLKANWVWVPDWTDSSEQNTAGRIVRFTRSFSLSSLPKQAILHCSADTRYKLIVNGTRVAVGPARSSTVIWYFDTVDISHALRHGENVVEFHVLRYFAQSRAAMPFERTMFPGLTVVGQVHAEEEVLSLDSMKGWYAQVNMSTQFPTGLIDDVFLHISERVSPATRMVSVTPKAYSMKTLNGDLLPWRLRPRSIPMPDETELSNFTVRRCDSSVPVEIWTRYLCGGQAVYLPQHSVHILEIQAETHSTAFLSWGFEAMESTNIKVKIMYSEGYELEPRYYPFFRTKKDRLDAENGKIIGPFDLVDLKVPKGQRVLYEPFWFRTFRLIRLEVTTQEAPVSLVSFSATQVNYPMAVKAEWWEPENLVSKDIWEVSIRTMRNCMFDGYSDCPFYEQLQYSCDSRSVGLFHYLLSGDDRLMRQAITNFAASVTPEGLTQSRFPSHVRQIIAGFPLYWILQVCDHHLYFGDTAFARSFLPCIDGVFSFFDRHINELGLVGGLPNDVWQYVDWVTSWGATEEHPDKGVPVSGRKNNIHTYFSLLYAYVLQKASQLLLEVHRPAVAQEYTDRANAVIDAVRKHCYDGRFFTDSTALIADEQAFSQHCQVFAVLAGAVKGPDATRLLEEAFAAPNFAKCSYMMRFYAFRAFSAAGGTLYDSQWTTMWQPYHQMLANNLTTWEEDDVRQRSDCHAWGSVPIYEYCTELAGVKPIAAGCSKISFQPRLLLSKAITAKIALGKSNLANVCWKTNSDGTVQVELKLEHAVDVICKAPGGKPKSCGLTDSVSFTRSSSSVV